MMVVGITANVRATIADQHFAAGILGETFGNRRARKAGADDKVIKHASSWTNHMARAVDSAAAAPGSAHN
jgi:hypothetical protein